MLMQHLWRRLALAMLVPVATCFSLNVHGQLTASFTSDTIQGCAPLVVKFQDQSSGSATSWRWEMGDGTILFVKNPATTYFKAGTYSVKLVVSNGSQSDSVIKTNYIRVYEVPQVNFRASDTSGCFPLRVQFTDMSLPMSGTIESWEWDFGDGSSSREANPVHVYETLGTYNVSLRVKNSNGCIQTLTRLRYVNIASGVRANFNFTAPNSCRPPTPVQFTNASTGTGALTYLWSFGDGGVSVAKDPEYIYNTAGSYQVRMVARNDFGCTDTAFSSGPISIGSVKADFDIPETVCAGAPLSLTNLSDPAPQTATWRFGDGTQINGVNAVKSFASEGIYFITLISNFGACRDSLTKSIRVLAKPSAAFTTAQTNSCKVPFSPAFTNESTGSDSFRWNFGNGEISTSNAPTPTYNNFGLYDVSLVAINSLGCRDSLMKKSYIRISRPLVRIENLPQEGCAPLNYNGRPVSVTGDSLVSFVWDFGDGSTSIERYPAHTYNSSGTYTVKLVYTTVDGCTDSVVYVNAIRVGVKPTVSFSAFPPMACAFQPINFNDATTPKPDRWEWNFGDGGTSADQSPAHVYSDTGSFTVSLTVWNNGCKDSLVIPNYITIKPPIARFIDSAGSCMEKLTRYFKDRSIGAKSWLWNFGDGNTSSDQHPAHVYAAPGSYLVSLTVTNDTCTNTIMRQVIIASLAADFTVSDTVVCKSDPVKFEVTNVDPVQVGSYTWDFGDGGRGFSGTTSHVYTTPGQYTIRLSLTDIYGCKDSIVRPLLILVNGPTAAFSSPTTIACDNTIISFADASTSDGRNGLSGWKWTFGDGTSDSTGGGNVSHVYTRAGFFTVTLKVTDSSGCSDSRSRSSYINISKPEARFTSLDTVSCTGSNIRFRNQSSGNSPQYLWHFGDTSTSTSPNPVHQYVNEGAYTITLYATDRYGCRDTAVRSSYINIRNPKALYDLSDSVATCPPLVVNFKNRSENINSFQWQFGDGTTSNLNDPGHFYTFPGRYMAKLVVAGIGGCTDSLSREIVVRGPEGSFEYTTYSGCTPTRVEFRGSTKDNASFVWDFNDGSVENGDSTIIHDYTRMGAYLPKMILVDPGGCRVPITGPDTIRVFGVESKFDLQNRIFCDSATIQFRNTSVANETISGYTWTFGDGTTSTSTNPIHSYRIPGQYQLSLIARTISGCVDTIVSEEPIVIAVKPIIAIEGPEGACIPANAEFRGISSAVSGDSLSWRWSIANNQTSNVQNPAPVVFGQAGTYNILAMALNKFGCSDTANMRFEAYPLPQVSAGSDQFLCEGKLATLSATGASTYNWYPAENLSCTDCVTTLTSTITDRTYRVTGLSANGCEGSDSVVIRVKHPFTITASTGDTLCRGETYAMSASGAELYSWTPSAGLSATSGAAVTARPDVTTTYQVIGGDEANCFYDTLSVPVVVYPYPTVEAGEDLQVSVGSSVTLEPTFSADVVSIRWTPASWLDCTMCPAPVSTPKRDITYSIAVANGGGCVTKDEITLHVFCNNANLFLPNTFTPNGDGHNDIFYPEGKGLYTIKTFRVFNRWGEVVFERSGFTANDASFGWNGVFNGKPAPQDVYVYTVDVICENQVVIQYKGNVALLR